MKESIDIKFEIGVYRHFKGTAYQVIGVGIHSETSENLVLYKELYNDTIWVRPLQMFIEDVEVNGELVPRFKFDPALTYFVRETRSK